MTQLFKEVTSTANADKAKSENLKEDAVEQAATSAEKEAAKKGKHGDPGVCCGGCS